MTEFRFEYTDPMTAKWDELCKSLELGSRPANEACIMMSIAISLKRIADHLERREPQ